MADNTLRYLLRRGFLLPHSAIPASIHPEIARSALHNAGAVLHEGMQRSLDFVLWWSTPLKTNVEPKDGTSFLENCLQNPHACIWVFPEANLKMDNQPLADVEGE